jgi:long-chain fatty acid transport protein
MPLAADGEAKVTGTDWSWGFNLGAMLNLSEHTRVGFAYRSTIKQDLEGRAEFRVPANFQALLDKGIPLFTNTDAYAGVDLPENISISLYHAFNDQWAILADATWTKWSRFDELRIDYGNPMQPATVQPEEWDDSWRYSLGAIYRPNTTWTFRIGWALDETPIPGTSERTPRIPGNDRTWVALGVGYQLSKSMMVDVAYSHLFVDDTRIDALDHSTGHQLVGEYNSDVDIVSAQLKWNF